MEKFTDIKLKSYAVKKEYYPEKSYVKCVDCPKLLHCSFCVQHLRKQNPHHWVGITVNEVAGCRGCQERYQKAIAEAQNEAVWLRKKLSVFETRFSSHAEDLKEAYELADAQLAAQQLAYEGAESVMEMDLRAQIQDLSTRPDEDAESIAGMKLRLELEKMKEVCEWAESRVTFLKRRPPDSAAAPARGGFGSTLPILGDVTFLIQGQTIYAHQLILGYRSRVFKKIFEELRLQMLQKIQMTLLQKIQVTSKHEETEPSIPPTPTPPPPPPPDAPRETSAEKLRKKRSERIIPLVKVRLASSSMLEQMGRRGVRCQLSVATGQALVDDATSQTPVPQSIQDLPETKSGGSGNLTEMETLNSGQASRSKRTISGSATVALPAVTSNQPQAIITPEATHERDPGMKPTVPAPTSQRQGEEKVQTVSDLKAEQHEKVVLQLLEQEEGPPITSTSLFQTLLQQEITRAAADGAQGCMLVIPVHDVSYAVMRAVIDCCYTADMEFTEEVTPGEVLRVAHEYEIEYLRDVCERELCRRLQAGNVAEMLRLGRKFGARRLQAQATQFFRDNFDHVHESVLGSCCR